MKTKLKLNTYTILQECVEIGILTGWNKAHRHLDKPDEDFIQQEIERCIMLELSEKINFK